MNYILPKVSVIIPTFNNDFFLKTTVVSVINQTYHNWECLICSDGCTDGSKKMIENFGDERIKWIDCGRNFGPGAPRNIGIKKSTGEYLAFLDSDDIWHPNKLTKQLEMLSQFRDVYACSSNAFRKTDDNNTTIDENLPLYLYI